MPNRFSFVDDAMNCFGNMKSTITFSKLRSLYSMLCDIVTNESNRQDEKISDDCLAALRLLRVHIRSAALMERKNVRLNFLTATALKQNGEFLLFPDMELILKNLWNSWNAIFPETPFNDENALRLLVRGTYITSYHL